MWRLANDYRSVILIPLQEADDIRDLPLQLSRLQATVDLDKALGGGWSAPTRDGKGDDQ